MKHVTSDTYKVSSSNKESSNEPILENNTDQIDSKNEIVHELLDVEFEHLQRCYQYLLDQPPNQPEQTISNNQCSNKPDVTKGYKVMESNVQNPGLNNVTRPLNKVPSCEELLTEIRKKYHDKYIAFTNIKQVLPDHPFPKGTGLIFEDSMLAGIEENQLKSGKYKVKVRYFPGALTDDMYDYMKPLLWKLPDYIILHIGTNDTLDKIHKGKFWIKLLS